MKNKKNSGFTLLELLIVIAILAVLSVALVLVLNPAETLKKSRDAQRISDLSTLKTAIGLYMTSVNPVYLGGISDNNLCKTATTDVWGVTPTTSRLSYSLPSASVTDTTLDGGTVGVRSGVTDVALVDGTGWVPVKFSNITGGSPISNLPLDPVNTVSTNVSNTDLVYRYGCTTSPLAYEIDAVLESSAYTSGADNKITTDGGNNSSYYETGTNLLIIGTGTDF